SGGQRSQDMSHSPVKHGKVPTAKNSKTAEASKSGFIGLNGTEVGTKPLDINNSLLEINGKLDIPVPGKVLCLFVSRCEKIVSNTSRRHPPHTPLATYF